MMCSCHSTLCRTCFPRDERRPSWDDVEVGDRVVVDVRGTVAACGEETRDGYHWLMVAIGDRRQSVYSDLTTLKSVEKPVRTFKPGDVVRYRANRKAVFFLAEGRYYDVRAEAWYKLDERDNDPFTSMHYTLVD